MTTSKYVLRGAALFALAALYAAVSLVAADEPSAKPMLQAGADDRSEGSPPERVIGRLGNTHLRQTDRFTSVAYSPDGATLASASYFGVVRLWNAADGSERTTLMMKDGGSLLAFSHDGKRLAATGCGGRGTQFWEVQKGGMQQLEFSGPGGNETLAIMFSPDGRLLAFGNSLGRLAVWDIEAQKKLFTVTSGRCVGAIAFSPDGKLLASGAGDLGIADDIGDIGVRLWDVSTGKAVGSLEGHKQRVLSVAFAPDGKTLASSSYDGTIRIWDVTKGETIRRIDAPVGRIAFSPDGKKLALASLNNVRFFDPASGECLREIRNSGGDLESLSFSPDGKTLAVAGGSSAIQIWDTTTGKEVSPPEGHLDAVADVVFSADGKTLASRGGDRSVRLWDLATLKQKRILSIGPGRFFGHEEDFVRITPRGLAFTPDGNKVACTGGYWGSADPPNTCVWDTTSGDLTKFTEPRHPPGSLAIAPDGETMATCCEYGIHLWSLISGKDLGLLSASWGTPAFLPDGKTLLAVSREHKIQLVDWRTRQIVRAISTGDSAFSFIAASPDGTLFATCGAVGRSEWAPVHIWETASGKLLRTLGDKKPDGARCASFASDGRRLVAATKDSVDVWDVLTGEELSAHDGKPLLAGGHKGDILCAAISPDGKTIASGGADTTILLWDAHDLLPETPATNPGPKDLVGLWDDLKSDDAPTAYKAILTLLGAPDQAAALLKQRVTPEPALDPKRVKALIDQLNSDDAEVRDAASRKLADLGEAIEPALREALTHEPPVEVKNRCERLLADLEKRTLDADGVRAERAVQVLERIGSPEARAVLKTLADGAPGHLSRAAKLGLDRLDHRSP